MANESTSVCDRLVDPAQLSRRPAASRVRTASAARARHRLALVRAEGVNGLVEKLCLHLGDGHQLIAAGGAAESACDLPTLVLNRCCRLRDQRVVEGMERWDNSLRPRQDSTARPGSTRTSHWTSARSLAPRSSIGSLSCRDRRCPPRRGPRPQARMLVRPTRRCRLRPPRSALPRCAPPRWPRP